MMSDANTWTGLQEVRHILEPDDVPNTFDIEFDMLTAAGVEDRDFLGGVPRWHL